MVANDLSRKMTDAELLALSGDTERSHLGEDGMRRGRNVHNPFAEVVGHPQGRANSKRWWQLHDAASRPDAVEVAHPHDRTAMEKIEETLRLKKFGVRVHRNETTGAAIYFPEVPHRSAQSSEQRALEEDWQDSCLNMHSNQYTHILDDRAPGGIKVVKKDAPEEVLRFEDSEYATDLRRGD